MADSTQVDIDFFPERRQRSAEQYDTPIVVLQRTDAKGTHFTLLILFEP